MVGYCYSAALKYFEVERFVIYMPKKQVKKSVVVSKKPKPKKSGLSKKMSAMNLSTPKPSNTVLGDIGQWAGNAVSKIFGWGAYELKQNSVYNDMTNAQVPVMHSTSETIVFRHREYICDISSSTLFAQTVFKVNPGLSSTFPYLSAIAACFQEYRFKGLVFEFKSTSADALNSTNTALGTVAMCAQYRADATSFLDKQQLLNEMWAIDSKPSCNFLLPIECSPVENPLSVQYVRTGSVPTGQDAKLYDLCSLTIGTYGSQAAAVVGELWATYEVEFFKPQLSVGLGLNLQNAHYYNTTASGSAYFGTTVIQSYDNIGLTVGATTVTFPLGCQGKYFVNCIWIGTAAAVVQPTLALTNCTKTAPVPFYFGGPSLGSAQSVTPANGVSSVILTQQFVILIPDPTLVAVITFSAGTLPTSITDGDLFVSQLNYNVS